MNSHDQNQRYGLDMQQGLDAVRLLCLTIQRVQHLYLTGEGICLNGISIGELILQDALEYLSQGDTDNTRILLDVYEEWKATGQAPWPWDSSKSPYY